jgi:DNA modification methylase
MTVRILRGDCRDVLKTMDAGSVHCCVTSPPYFGLRDYGHAGQIGLEATPDAFVAEMVAVFREVRRVLRDDATLWLNLGDSYNAYNGGAGPSSSISRGAQTEQRPQLTTGYSLKFKGLKPKDLIGIPWRVAFALQADGWYLRQDIIWSKPNPMPESVTDRCTKAHEYIFLLSKSQRYFYDHNAIREDFVGKALTDLDGGPQRNRDGSNANEGRDYNANRASYKPGSASNMQGDKHVKKSDAGLPVNLAGRNKRSVWTITTSPFAEAHFATFPPDLIDPCIKAGCPAGGVVLDPFGGAGTTGLVADRLQRDAIMIELNPEYADIADRRIKGDGGMFSTVL